MQRWTWLVAVVAPALAIGVLSESRTGNAGPGGTCEDLGLVNPVFLRVGSTQEPLLKELGTRLADADTNPMTLFYVTSGTCTNIEAIRTNTALNAGDTIKYVPAGLDPTSAAPTCTLGATTPLDLANGVVFPTACTQDPAPAEVTERLGPVQAFVFAVPEASTEVAITAEEAYFVLGFGEAGMVTPWQEEEQVFFIGPTNGTPLALGAAIGVPAFQWQGTTLPLTPDVVAALQSAPDPGVALGTLGAEVYDRNRATLDALAFRAYGQRYAYYADSTTTSFDKQNVRDGHYFPWSPTLWMTREGSPNHDRAVALVDLIVGATSRDDIAVSELEIAVGLVPRCAMHVTRDLDGGPLRFLDDPAPCDCQFDALTDETDCVACDGVTRCAEGVCRHGYCEAR